MREAAAARRELPTHQDGSATAPPARHRRRWRVNGTVVRLLLTVWLFYSVHATTNVVRETYLALSIAERLSIRVDDYVGLHPDIFEIPGRGAYINNNPGASMLAAIPYTLARPVVAAVFAVRPDLARPKPPSSYDDPRPNRTKFLNLSRARGLDVKLPLAALLIGVGFMAPLAALTTVLLFGFLRRRGMSARGAIGVALLYAFGTPIFFRSAFLNQNAMVAHCALLAFLALADRPAGSAPGRPRGNRIVIAGALLGVAVLCDYSGVPLIVAFGLWLMFQAWRTDGPGRAVRSGVAFTLGALPPLLLLLGYQWIAFGNPLYPAQHYMPATELSVRGADGFAWPTIELLVRNLLDPAYGLFAFCPMLLAALAAPAVLRWRSDPETALISPAECWLLLGAAAALYLFSSANQFALLQWNTGVRYLVPAGSLLFVALVPVLRRLPLVARWAIVLPTVVISWSVSMARESVPLSLAHVFIGGFELPVLTVIQKTAAAYAPFAAEHVSPIPIFVLLGVVIWALWHGAVPHEPR